MATFGTFVDDETLKASEINSLLALTTFTPVLTQSNSIPIQASKTAFYFKVNKLIIGVMKVKTASNGIGGNAFIFDLPVAASSGSYDVIGTGFVLTSISDFIRMAVVKRSDGKASFLSDAATSVTGYYSEAIGNTFELGAVFCYEAA